MMKVDLGNQGHHPFSRHRRLHRFHGSRFPLSFFATRCHIPCMRVYTDSETGSDVQQQESLLENAHHPVDWDDADFSYPFHNNSNQEQDGNRIQSQNFSRQNSISTQEDANRNHLTNSAALLLHSPGTEQRNSHGSTAGLNLWSSHFSSLNMNRSILHLNQNINLPSASIVSLPGYGDNEDADSVINSLPGDSSENTVVENRETGEMELSGNQPSLLDEVLSSIDRRFRTSPGLNNENISGDQVQDQPVFREQPVDQENSNENMAELCLEESALQTNEENSNETDNPESPGLESQASSPNTEQAPEPLPRAHSPQTNLLPQQELNTFRPTPPAVPLPMPTVSDDNLSSISGEQERDNINQEWYFYDPRLAPGAGNSRINFNRSLRRFVDPPNYEEAMGLSPRAGDNSLSLLSDEEANGLEQQSDSGQSLPPPYQDEPPPSYEQSFHHRLLLSSHGNDQIIIHRDNPVSNLNGLSHLLRHIPLTTEGNSQSHILVRDTNSIFLPDTDPVQVQDIIQDSDSLRDSDLVQDFFLLEDNHDCGESTTDQDPSADNPGYYQMESLGELNLNGETIPFPGNSPNDTVRSHASSVLQLSMSLRRYPVGSNLGQRPALRWSRGIGVDRWADSTNWII